MVLCHYDVFFISEEEDPVYTGDGRRVILTDRDVTFDLFESQVGRFSSSGRPWLHVPAQGDSIVKLYLHDLCNVERIRIYIIKSPG